VLHILINAGCHAGDLLGGVERRRRAGAHHQGPCGNPGETDQRKQDQKSRPAKAGSQPPPREGVAPQFIRSQGLQSLAQAAVTSANRWICDATPRVTGRPARIRSTPCPSRYESVRDWSTPVLGVASAGRRRAPLYRSRCSANATPRATTTVRSTTGWRRRASATPMNPPAALIGTMTTTASHDTGPKKAK